MSKLDMLQGRPWAVMEGDCKATLAGLPEESVDACVTDTPYGLSTLLDPPNLDREALWRKLTAGTAEAPIRTLLRAWLDTGDNPVMKGRGFMGKEWDALVPSPNTWRAVWRVLKPGAYCLAFGGTRTCDLISMSLRLADFEVDDQVMWLYGQGFPKRVRLDLKIDQHFGAEQRIEGDLRRTGRERNQAPGQWAMAAGGTAKAHAATPDAARFVGWDRALRPGWEPVIVAVKPMRGTVAENALRYGTGGLHVDACRLPRGDGGFTQDARGGYPANVAMDEEAAAMLDAQSGVSKSPPTDSMIRIKAHKSIGIFEMLDCVVMNGHGDSGGASRFFYVAKASSSERDAGLADLPALTAGERCDREDGTAGTRGEGGRNPHPTVKPVALMRWLCRLVSPPGTHDADLDKRPVILDPFTGSGSTGVAALAEGARFLGCELMPEYADVARRRLQHTWTLPPDDPQAPERKPDAPGQGVLF